MTVVQNIPLYLSYAIIYSCALAWTIFYYFDDNTGTDKDYEKNKYKPFVYGNRFPFCILLISLVYIGLDGFQYNKTLYRICFNILPIISIFYTFIIIFASFLRSFLQRRSMTILWLMPTLLLIYQNKYMGISPKIIFHTSEKILNYLLLIWSIGFILVFLYHIITHFLLRKTILTDAITISEERILTIWEKELSYANKKSNSYALLSSNLITSPITIGMFDKTSVVVLPNKYYTDEELKLILRHEILHIVRKDVGSKFYIVFIKALCWYNPFMWISMKKCSEDIELSCDEAVLHSENDETRKLYAHIILSSADTEKGFTSCLSAKASSLRYRLTNIMKHKTRKSGALLIGVLFFILCISCSTFGFTYGKYNAIDLIYKNHDKSEYNHFEVTSGTSVVFPNVVDISHDEFYALMQNIELSNMSFDYDFSHTNRYYVRLKNNNDSLDDITIWIHDNVFLIDNKYYYSKEKIDFSKYNQSYPYGKSEF